MANLSKVIYINEVDYSTLLNGGTITKGGVTYSHDPTALYVIKNVSAPEYAETAGYATTAGQATKATQDGGGNVISETYEKEQQVIIEFEISGNDIIFTNLKDSEVREICNNSSKTVLLIDVGNPGMDNERAVYYCSAFATDYWIFSSTSTMRGGGNIIVFYWDDNYKIINLRSSSDLFPAENVDFGQAYGISSNNANSAARTSSISGFRLKKGGIVAIKFTTDIDVTGPSLNISSTGSKPIYYRGSAPPRGTVNAGDTVTFIYDGTYYHIISIDKDIPAPATTAPIMDGTATIGTSGKYAKEDHVHPSDTSRVPTSRKINNKPLSSDITLNASDVGAIPTAISTTYANLVTTRTSSQLTAGAWYRITDYNCTTTQTDTQSAGHQFDILVQATSPNTLSEEAKAIRHEGDTYFANSNFEDWKIWYCLDNDTTRFAWADITNGKGVIYRMIDEWGNDCPYDFKNIQFKRWAITSIKNHNNQSINDLEHVFKYDSENNPICFGYKGSGYQIGRGSCTVDSNTSVFYYTFSRVESDGNIMDNSIVGNTMGNDEDLYQGVINNVFKPSSNGINEVYGINDTKTCLRLCDNVFVSTSVYDENMPRGVFGNTFGTGCYHNTFGNECKSNIFGNYCSSNTFGNNYSLNTFGNYCSLNIFGDESLSNSFGSNVSHNTFGNYCSSNTFGHECFRNLFGNYLLNNIFGNYFQDNIFGNICNSNTFGNNVNHVTFSKDCIYYVIIENGNQFITLTSTKTTSSNNLLRNITIAQGVNNTSTMKTISHNTLNDTFRTTYTTDVNGNIYAIAPAKYNEWDNKQSTLISGTNIKTINNQSLLGSGNLTASDIGAITRFVVDFTLSGTTISNPNKTFSEIKAAYDAGNLVLARDGTDGLYYLLYCEDTGCGFFCSDSGTLYAIDVDSTDSWEYHETSISGLEFNLSDKSQIIYMQKINNNWKKLTYSSSTGTWSVNNTTLTGNTKNIYLDKDNNDLYYWDGSEFVLVDEDNVQADWNQSDSSKADYIKNKPVIPNSIKVGSVAGKLYRNDVNGGGNFTVKGNSGCIPNLTAGTFLVSIYTNSTTQSYTFKFNFGSVSYNLSTTNGEINDVREITIPSNGTFSGSVLNGSVAPGTILYVVMYNYLTPVSTVGVAAVTNRYSDLDGTPTIPTVNNGTLTIKNHGVTVGTFTANQSGNTTADITTEVITVSGTGSITQALDANKFYKFGSVSALTLTLNAAGSGLAIYAGKFTASANNISITLPSGTSITDSSVDIESGNTYEFSILDGVCIIMDVTTTT